MGVVNWELFREAFADDEFYKNWSRKKEDDFIETFGDEGRTLIIQLNPFGVFHYCAKRSPNMDKFVDCVCSTREQLCSPELFESFVSMMKELPKTYEIYKSMKYLPKAEVFPAPRRTPAVVRHELVSTLKKVLE